MSQPAQSNANHAKMVPMYHQVLSLHLLVVLGAALYWFATDLSVERFVAVVLAVALLMTALWARLFAMGVQDRVIRLEERLRMERILPEDLKPRIQDVSTDQLIGLRFASDDELPELVRRVLGAELSDRKSIKAAVQNWRPDHQRV